MHCPGCQLELPLSAAESCACPGCRYALTRDDMESWLNELSSATLAGDDFDLDDDSSPRSTIQRTLDSSAFARPDADDFDVGPAGGMSMIEAADANQRTLDPTAFPRLDDERPADDPRKTAAIEATLLIPPKLSDALYDSDSDATLDSATLHDLARQSDDDEGTFDERRLAATYDSGIVSESQGAAIAGMWRGTHSPTTTPRMTIKRDGRAESPRDSRLVIKTKALSENPNPQTPLRNGADYELLNVIGEGGVGVVYAARQASIDRTVAIKMLKAAGAKSPEQREKFLSEAVVTADLDHPNIVPIYELGSNEAGALFYSMKKVQGTPWSKALPLRSPIENLEILMKVADAVGFAHARGVIHRDLKPENVMLGEFGEVLVMDWGLAIATAEFRKIATITQTTSMGGTPAYMSPEMAAGPMNNVGPKSDVYLLGAMLFEILTGQPPHTGKTVMKCLLAAARNEILETKVTGELMEIALKAMSTKLADRYASVREFQAAIREYEAHSESLALLQRADEMLKKARAENDYENFSRAVFAYEEAAELWPENPHARNGSIAARLEYAEVARSRDDLELADSLLLVDESTHTELKAKLALEIAEEKKRIGRLRTARRVMAVMAVLIVASVTGGLLLVNREREKAVDARDNEALARQEAETEKALAVKARDQEKLAKLEERNARAAAENARQDALAAKTVAEKAQVAAEAAKEAEKYESYVARIGLASAKVSENAFGDVAALLKDCPDSLRDWEWGRLKFLCGRAEATIPVDSPPQSLAVSPDGTKFAAGCADGGIRVWERGKYDQPLLTITSEGEYVYALAWSPDGTLLAAGGDDPRGRYLRLYDAATGESRGTLDGHTDAVTSVRFSKSGRELLSASYDKTARVWNLADRKSTRILTGHTWWVWSAEWSPDESRIVTAGHDGKCIVWDLSRDDLDDPRNLALFTGHAGPVYAAAFSPDGKSIASAGYDQHVLVWAVDQAQPFDFEKLGLKDAPASPAFRMLVGHGGPVRSVRYFADGRILSSSGDNTLRVWDASGKTIQTLRGHSERVAATALLDAGTRVLSAGRDGLVKIWNLQGYEEARVLKGKVLAGHTDAVLGANFSRDDRFVVTAGQDRTARIWNVAAGTPVETLAEGHDFLTTGISLFADGRRFATAAMDDTTRIWDLATGTELLRIPETGRTSVVAVSHDGTRVVTGSAANAAQLFRVADGERLLKFDGHRGEVTAAAWSPKDALLATGDSGGQMRVHDPLTGRLVWSAERHSGTIVGLAFSADGKTLYSASADHTVGCANALDGKEDLARVWKHPAPIQQFALSADGKIGLTIDVENVVRIWNPETARVERELTGLIGRATGAALAPDGGRALIVCVQEKTQPKPENADDDETERTMVQLFDPLAGREIPDARLIGKAMWTARFTADSNEILTVGGNGARLWNLKTRAPTMSFLPHGAVAGADFSPDGSHVVTGSWDSTAKIWNIARDRAERKLPLEHRGPINAALYSPDGKTLLTVSDDRTAILWNVADATVKSRLIGHTDRIRAGAWYADGSRVVTVGNDRSGRIWDTATGKLVHEFSAAAAPLTSVAVSRDAKWIVVGCENNTALLFDGSTFAPRGELAGHTAQVTDVDLSPGGTRVVTGSADATVKVWDPAQKQEILTLAGHDREVTAVRFSHDGRLILSTARDGTGILWLADEWKAAGGE